MCSTQTHTLHTHMHTQTPHIYTLTIHQYFSHTSPYPPAHPTSASNTHIHTYVLHLPCINTRQHSPFLHIYTLPFTYTHTTHTPHPCFHTYPLTHRHIHSPYTYTHTHTYTHIPHIPCIHVSNTCICSCPPPYPTNPFRCIPPCSSMHIHLYSPHSHAHPTLTRPCTHIHTFLLLFPRMHPPPHTHSHTYTVISQTPPHTRPYALPQHTLICMLVSVTETATLPCTFLGDCECLHEAKGLS